MHAFLGALLLAAGVDGEAALRHAASLAALGPHAWGSPRSAFAAAYVKAQFVDAGLEEVRLQPFERGGIAGSNVIGVLRGAGPEFVVVGAHHDTAPDAPGAYDDGGGVGVLIETARVLARQKQRPRTLVFVSFDGEEAWSTGRTTTAGSRAYVEALGPEARSLVAAFDVEMCGWSGGHPVLHPIAYADPLRPGAYAISPAWLVNAAQEGARAAGGGISVGDPLLSWIYQPAVRTFKVKLYGDDLSFLQAGQPALFASDSSLAAFYPWYHKSGDTSDKLDAAALGRMGAAVLGVVDALARVRAEGAQPDWFAAFGHTFGVGVLGLLLLAALAPSLVAALRAGGSMLALRGLQGGLVAALFWTAPVPATWTFVLPLALLASTHLGVRALGLLPALALAAVGAVAWSRGLVSGTWLAPWQLGAAAVALALCFVRRKAAGGRAGRPGRKAAGPPAKRKRK